MFFNNGIISHLNSFKLVISDTTKRSKIYFYTYACSHFSITPDILDPSDYFIFFSRLFERRLVEIPLLIYVRV